MLLSVYKKGYQRKDNHMNNCMPRADMRFAGADISKTLCQKFTAFLESLDKLSSKSICSKENGWRKKVFAKPV